MLTQIFYIDISAINISLLVFVSFYNYMEFCFSPSLIKSVLFQFESISSTADKLFWSGEEQICLRGLLLRQNITKSEYEMNK